MSTPARIGGHPIHPMLVPLAIGLWVFSLVCDLIYRFGGGSDVWVGVAFYTLAGGIVGALLAAVPGFIDLLSLPPGKVKKVAVAHMAINLVYSARGGSGPDRIAPYVTVPGSPAYGRAKATSASPRRVPRRLWPPAAMTTYCRPLAAR